jgi:hypothetical protein
MVFAAIIAACSAAYPSVANENGEWVLMLAGTSAQLPLKLEFEAPAGAKFKQDRTVGLSAWQASQTEGMATATVVGGFDTLTTKAQATRFLAGIRMWDAPLTAGELACKLEVSKEGTNPIAVAILCNTATITDFVVIAQRVGGPSQTVRVRATSTSGPIAELGAAKLTKEIAHRGTKAQPAYVWEVLATPTTVAFGSSAAQVAFTLALAIAPMPIVPLKETAQPEVTVAQAPPMKPTTETAIVPVVNTPAPTPKLGAGLEVLPPSDMEPPTERQFGGKVPPTVFWYGIAFATILIIGLVVGFSAIYGVKKYKKLEHR